MTGATAADYGWIHSPSLFAFARDVGYAMTLVRGVTPDEVLTRAGARARRVCAGGDELTGAYWDFLDENGYDLDDFLVGAFTVPGEGGDWALVLELGGESATSPRLLSELSAGTRAVSHSDNGGKPLHFFHWYEDGRLRTSFDGPAYRTGSTPDELNAELVDLGLNPFGDRDPATDEKAAILALTERLTGVRLTPDLLEAAEYQVGEVPAEPAEEWESITVDVTDAHGKRTYAQIRRDQL